MKVSFSTGMVESGRVGSANSEERRVQESVNSRCHQPGFGVAVAGWPVVASSHSRAHGSSYIYIYIYIDH